MLVRSGIRLFKFWFSVSRAEQLRRFMGRASDPLKQWKLSPIDAKAPKLWDAYTRARNEMLTRTHSVFAPWVVVRADDKAAARLALIRDILTRSGIDGTDGVLPDPSVAFLFDPAAMANGMLAK